MAGTVEQWLITAPQDVFEVVLDVVRERSAQDAKWGEQNHPDGTGPHVMVPFLDHRLGSDMAWLRDRARERTDEHAVAGSVTYLDILLEEVLEGLAESDPVKLRLELVQGAAVIVQWIEAIDRREAGN